jgi:glucose/arabinose dehydrogenase
MKKYVLIVAASVILLLLAGLYLLQDRTPSAQTPSNDNNSAATTSNNLGLTVPPNFSISIYARELPGARQIVFDDFGNMWVSQPSRGAISMYEAETGKVNVAFRNLNNPHGIAIRNNTLYFAEEDKITRVALYSDDRGQKIADLPVGGRHTSRTLEIGPDERLYVSIGSTCDVCVENDPRHAAIYSMKTDGTGFGKVAGGLRNAVFFDWSYVDGRMWATEMGRDNLGDNLPPDEINIIESGKDYGWPLCYGKNVPDTKFNANSNASTCSSKAPSRVDLPAHSAPLGLAFIPEEGWPEDYWYDLIVAYHGSWNRSEKTGYKLVRVKLDAQGNYEGTEDFITGWLRKDGQVSGRPVDVYARPGGELFVSDDEEGVVYRITYNNSAD